MKKDKKVQEAAVIKKAANPSGKKPQPVPVSGQKNVVKNARPADMTAQKKVTPAQNNVAPTTRPATAPVRPAVSPVTQSQPTAVNPVMNGAVLKPVAGGLQPIIAPKGQVQLAPVVVPVAFVPYATQNQPMLQYEKKPKPVEKPVPKAVTLADQPKDKNVASEARRKKKSPKIVEETDVSTEDESIKMSKGAVRISAAIILVLSILYVLPGLLANFMPEMKIMGRYIEQMSFPNVIYGLTHFAFKKVGMLVFIVTNVLAVINMVFCIISLITGKNFKFWINALIITVLTLVGILGAGLLFPDLFTGVAVGIMPIGDNSGAWRLFAVALFMMIISILLRQRKHASKKKDKKGKGDEEVVEVAEVSEDEQADVIETENA
ncbi:MAG: hypothetical protein RR357_05445 [Clostridia bacterium]